LAPSKSSRSAWFAAVLALCALGGAADAVAQSRPPQDRAPKLSSVAERVYQAARPRLLQIRTLLGMGGRQSSIGSGFLVSASGLAVTNYHVVSQYALEPGTYRLEYTAADGRRGTLQLLGFDVANDVALVQMDKPAEAFFQFEALARQTPAKGERLYSMGNPLDLGFTIIEGTYNGTVERSYNERIHFSGALNPGMSGGPAVSAASRIVGVNVAKRLDGELVSFLVPARFAADLVARAAGAAPLSPEAIRAEIGRQLAAWQAGLYKALAEAAPRFSSFGPYRFPESPAALFTCWSHTNANQVPKPRATVNSTHCYTNTSVFLAGDLNTGQVRTAHSYLKSGDLNDFQFAAFVSRYYQTLSSPWNRKRHTRTRCHEAVLAEAAKDRPSLRTVWCAKAYRDFDGLYDVAVLALTQDRAREALVARLSMQGVTYENALQMAQRFVGELRLAE
jgi:S1-C subfamily serine protease